MPETKKADNTMLLSDVRLSYFYCYDGYKDTDDNGKTRISFPTHAIMDANHPQLGALQALIRKVAAAAWKDKAEEVLAQLKAQDRLCVHRGDTAKPGQDPYRGKIYVSANNKVRPRLLASVDGINMEVPADHELAPYSGCRANVMIDIWAQLGEGKSAKFGKRINATVTGVQFRRHGERLGGGGKAASLDEFGVQAQDADGAEPETAGGGLI